MAINKRDQLIAQINTQVKQNGSGKITGTVLNDIFKKTVELIPEGKSQYELIDMVVAQSCTGSSNKVEIKGKVKILQALSYYPVLYGIATINGIIREGGGGDGKLLLDTPYPVQQNQLSSEFVIDIELEPEDYPASIALHLQDQFGNYATVYEYSIAENPCNQVLVINSGLVVAAPETFERLLQLNITTEDSSGEFSIEFRQGTGEWATLKAFTASGNGTTTVSFGLNNMLVASAVDIRLKDDVTGSASSAFPVSFEWPYTEEWNTQPALSYVGFGSRLYVSTNYTYRPAGVVTIEYNNGTDWITLHTYSVSASASGTETYGDAFNIPEITGNYTVRLRHSETGVFLVSDPVVFTPSFDGMAIFNDGNADKTVTIVITGTADVDWGDGNTSTFTDETATHTYSETDTYTVKLRGAYSGLNFTSGNLTQIVTLPSSLTLLICNSNLLTTLPALPSGLLTLSCPNNQITSLPALPPYLINLNCSTNNITSLPAFPNTLQALHCTANSLSSLGTLPPTLVILDASDNDFTSLPDIPSTVTTVYCMNNQLTTSAINTLLGQLATSGLNSGTVLCDSQSPAAPPDGLGIISVSELINLRSWSVTTDTIYHQFTFDDYNADQTVVFGVTGTANIDWGDGYTDTVTNGTASHVYSSGSTFTVVAEGLITTLDFSLHNNLLSLDSLPVSLQSINCVNNHLTALPPLPASLTAIQCSNNQLTALPAIPGSVTGLYFDSNQLSAAAINALINSLATNGANSGTLYCNNQTPPAPPSGAALYSQSVLVNSRSWYVVTDTVYHELTFNDNNADQTVSFIVTGSSSIDWGDGNTESTSSITTVSHTYASGSLYTVKLTGDITELSLTIGSTLTNISSLPITLTTFTCSLNPLITSLPYLPFGLQNLVCESNQLTSLPALPGSLITLNCFGNALTSLPTMPPLLSALVCSSNSITSLPALPASLTELRCYANQLTYLPTLPASLYYISSDFNQLTSLPSVPAIAGYISFANNQLSSSVVNALLAQLVSNGQTGGSVGVSGQTPAAPPTAAGLTAASILVNQRGWTVYTDEIIHTFSFDDTNSDKTVSFTVVGTADIDWGDGNTETGTDVTFTHVYSTGSVFAPLVKGPISQINFDSHGNLTGISSLPISLYALYCTTGKLTTLPELPVTLAMLFCNNNQLVSLPALPGALTYIECSANNLTTLPTFLPSLTTIFANNNQLTTTAVNSLLAQLVVAGFSGGNLNISGQTPATPPSGNGLVSLSILLYLRSWTITTDDIIHTMQFDDSNADQTVSFYFDGTADIDWGDGNTESATSTTVTHVYSSGTAYTVSVKGALTNINFNSNGNLTSISSLPPSLTNLNCAGNKLSTLPPLPVVLTVLNCSNNLLSSSAVNAMLSQFTTEVISGGTFNSLGQTPAAPPTGSGIYNASVLVNILGWSLTTDTIINQLTFNDSNSDQTVTFDVSGSASIDWGDGNTDSVTNGTASHVYSSGSSFNVFLSGTITGLDFGGHGNLTAIGSLPIHLTSLQCQSNQLTGLPQMPASLLAIQCQYNMLTSSVINSLLAQFVAEAIYSGTLISIGQTPTAPPTGQGVTHYATLASRGWSLSTD